MLAKHLHIAKGSQLKTFYIRNYAKKQKNHGASFSSFGTFLQTPLSVPEIKQIYFIIISTSLWPKWFHFYQQQSPVARLSMASSLRVFRFSFLYFQNNMHQCHAFANRSITEKRNVEWRTSICTSPCKILLKLLTYGAKTERVDQLNGASKEKILDNCRTILRMRLWHVLGDS